MTEVRIKLPKEINKAVKIYQAEKEFKDKKLAIIDILKRYFQINENKVPSYY